MEKPKDREIECSLNKEQEEQRIYAAMACLNLIGASRTIPNALEKKKDSLGDLVRALLKVDRIERGRITCTFTVNPTFAVIPPQFLSLFSVLSFFIFLFLGGIWIPWTSLSTTMGCSFLVLRNLNSILCRTRTTRYTEGRWG